MTDVLPPLPIHPPDAEWPTLLWPISPLPGTADAEAIDRNFSALFDPKQAKALGRTHALLVAHRGAIVAEHYAQGVHAASTLSSWSMAKSVLHAVVGVLVGDGRLDLDAPAAVPEWQGDSDPRGAITLRHLLTMRDGLDFQEDYIDGYSDVIQMLFNEEVLDTAGYAAARPLAHEPGTFSNYSSGTSNIVSRIVAAEVGTGSDYEAFLRDRILDPIGMRSSIPKFDGVGTWIGSSYLFSTARDFARFGELYLRDGLWEGTRLLPEGWVDMARTETGRDEGRPLTAHWWLFGDNPWGAFKCSGYEGQSIICVPTLDLVVVRLGKTDALLRENVDDHLRNIISAFE